MSHTINVNDINDFISSHAVTFASSSRPKKKFTISLAQLYRVYHDAELVYEGTDMEYAIDRYNDI